MKDSSKIGLTGAVALVIANMMGRAFSLPLVWWRKCHRERWSFWLGRLEWIGSWGHLLWDLVRQWPESGGEYLFLSRALHPSMGYGGMGFLFVGFSAPTAAAAYAAVLTHS